jgi:large subunit ribosomal protein L7/L12
MKCNGCGAHHTRGIPEGTWFCEYCDLPNEGKAPPVPVRAAPAPAAPAPASASARYDLVLTSFNNNKIGVIKAVREISGLGLKEAKELVDNPPSVVKVALTRATAEQLKRQIEAAGGSAKFGGESHGAESPHAADNSDSGTANANGAISRANIVNALSAFKEEDDFFIGADIPSKKLANATDFCELSMDDEVLALMDLTVFGSAKNAIIIGMQGIYYHNDGNAAQPGVHHIPYSVLRERRIKPKGMLSTEVDLGQGSTIDVSGCAMSTKQVSTILCALRDAL